MHGSDVNNSKACAWKQVSVLANERTNERSGARAKHAAHGKQTSEWHSTLQSTSWSFYAKWDKVTYSNPKKSPQVITMRAQVK